MMKTETKGISCTVSSELGVSQGMAVLSADKNTTTIRLKDRTVIYLATEDVSKLMDKVRKDK